MLDYVRAYHHVGVKLLQCDDCPINDARRQIGIDLQTDRLRKRERKREIVFSFQFLLFHGKGVLFGDAEEDGARRRRMPPYVAEP